MHIRPVTSTDPGCFGVGCPTHALCARYAAVDGDQADMHQIISTCVAGDGTRPLFVAIVTPNPGVAHGHP